MSHASQASWLRRKWATLLLIVFMAWTVGAMVRGFLMQTWRGFVEAAGQIWRDGA